jgi:hypothetical protein
MPTPIPNVSLKDISPITFAVERLFRGLQCLSPTTWLFGTRVEGLPENPESRLAVVKRRAWEVEIYMLCWLLIESCAAAFAVHSPITRTPIMILAGLRVLDVLQAVVNVNIFDQLRGGSGTHFVASLVRTVILALWNYLELILCFGIIYSCMLPKLKNVGSSMGAYYFSVVTQLTIGYGDVQPVDSARFVTSCQAIVGFLVAIIAIARLIAFLPRVEPIVSDS